MAGDDRKTHSAPRRDGPELPFGQLVFDDIFLLFLLGVMIPLVSY